MTRLYILNARDEPVPCDDPLEWGRWYGTSERRIVGCYRDKDIHVSTIFLGIDSNWFSDGPPVLWETMIFGGAHDQYQVRYTSRADAARGHAEALVLAGVTPPVAVATVHG